MNKIYLERQKLIKELMQQLGLEALFIYSNEFDDSLALWLLGIPTVMFNCLYFTKSDAPIIVCLDYLTQDLKTAQIKLMPVNEQEFPRYINSLAKKFARIGIAGPAPFNMFLGINSRISDTNNYFAKFLFIKSNEEIKQFKQGSRIIKTMLNNFSRFIKKGISEKFLASCLTAWILKKQLNLASISITSGKDLQKTTDCLPSNKIVKQGEGLDIDLMVKINNFKLDANRMYFLNPEAQVIYQKLVRAQKNVAQKIVAGITISKIRQLYKQEFKKFGLPVNFTDEKFWGHSLGFRLHEYPIFGNKYTRNFLLRENMIFTLEPEIRVNNYLYRIENMFLIEKGMCQELV